MQLIDQHGNWEIESQKGAGTTITITIDREKARKAELILPAERPLVVSGQFSVPTTLKIYNIRGQLVRTLVDESKMAGSYEVIWNGKDETGVEVASGVHLYKLTAGEYTESQKMILMK
ncbi:MAG: FlgD immunoglobulin-like domain containing protein [Candidatus Zixiibacteriota bacterium]